MIYIILICSFISQFIKEITKLIFGLSQNEKNNN